MIEQRVTAIHINRQRSLLFAIEYPQPRREHIAEACFLPDVIGVRQISHGLCRLILWFRHRRDAGPHNPPFPALEHALNLARPAVPDRAVHEHVHARALRHVCHHAKTQSHTHIRTQQEKKTVSHPSARAQRPRRQRPLQPRAARTHLRGTPRRARPPSSLPA